MQQSPTLKPVMNWNLLQYWCHRPQRREVYVPWTGKVLIKKVPSSELIPLNLTDMEKPNTFKRMFFGQIRNKLMSQDMKVLR